MDQMALLRSSLKVTSHRPPQIRFIGQSLSVRMVFLVLFSYPNLFHDQMPAYLVSAQGPATVGSAPPSANPILRCYTCMSGRISNISRELFPRAVNRSPPPGSSLQTGVPKTAVETTRQGPPYPVHHDEETNVCDDPFQQEDSLLEPCDTACIKTISKNTHTQIVLRGCLSSVINNQNQSNRSSEIPQMPPMGKCDDKMHENENIGQVATQTCLCNTDRCNGAAPVFLPRALFALAALFPVLIFKK